MTTMFPAFHNLDDFKCKDQKQVKFIRSCSAGPITDVNGVFLLVTLAFLFPVQNTKTLKILLMKLLNGESEVRNTIPDEEVKTLYEFLNKYNPFQNRRSCFHNEIFLNVVKKFEGIMWYRMKGKQNYDPVSHSFLMKEASDFLKCNIVLCDVVSKNIDVFSIFPDNIFPDCILTLWATYQETIPSQKFYTIGITHTLGKKLQEKAVKIILLEGSLSLRVIKSVTSFSSRKDNITLKMLNKDMISEVSLLFRQPSVLLKITEAGYDVDPTICDDTGKSALYYAIEKGKKDLVLLFCSYLLNLKIETALQNAHLRGTAGFFLINLQRITSILCDHKLVFQRSPNSNPEHIVFLEQLLKINRFHTAITHKLLEIAGTVRFTDIDSFWIFETDKQRVKMNVILSTYIDYFNYADSLCTNHNSSEISLRRFASYACGFKRFEWFYNLLDLRTALLFFDDMFALKQSLHIGDSSYEKPESAFFLFVFTSHFFQFKRFSLFEQLLPKAEKKKLAIDKTCFSHIICIERLKCLEHLQAFNRILDKTVVKKENANENVQNSCPEPLESLPEIRDVIIFRTVLHYLNVVSELKRKLGSKKCTINEQAVLVTERTLQVVGESLNERFTDSVSLGKSLLVSTLPIKVRKTVRDVRDKLSHVDGKTSEARKRIEGNKELFSAIMEELDDIKSRFVQSYFVLELIEYEYMFQHGLTRLKEMHLMLNRSNDSDNRDSKQCIAELSENVEKDIHFLENAGRSIQRIICTFRQHYTTHLKAHFDYLIYYITEPLKMSKPNRRTKILFHLECSDVLLSHFLKCDSGKLRTSTKELLNLMDDVKSVLTGNKEKELSEETTQETVKEKINSVMGICQSVCVEEQSLRKSGTDESKKNKKLSHGSSSQKTQSGQRAVRSIGKKIQQSLVSKIKSRGYNKGTSKTDIHRRGSRTDTSPIQLTETNDNPHIVTLANSLQSFYPITPEEQQLVLDSVSTKFKENSEAKTSLQRTFESIINGQKFLTDDVRDEIESQIEKLIQSKKKLTLKADFADENLLKDNLVIVGTVRDDYGDLNEHFRKNEMIDGKDFDRYCENLELTSNEQAKSLLKRCVKGRPFETANDAMLRYLRDKVIVLEYLLLTSNPRVDRLWRDENPITKQQVIFLIKEQYVRDRVLQASVEMLLFDCMNILRHRTDLKSLWTKATNLFSGINLRNILAHGNPLFKQIGLILNPNDLPSEIISKCLELVEDRKALDAMCTLLEGTDRTSDTLISALRVRESGSEELCDIINGTPKWQDYALLLPRKSFTEIP